MIGSEYVRKCDGTYKTVAGRKELQKLFTFWPQVSNARVERADAGDQVHFDRNRSIIARTGKEKSPENGARGLRLL